MRQPKKTPPEKYCKVIQAATCDMSIDEIRANTDLTRKEWTKLGCTAYRNWWFFDRYKFDTYEELDAFLLQFINMTRAEVLSQLTCSEAFFRLNLRPRLKYLRRKELARRIFESYKQIGNLRECCRIFKLNWDFTHRLINDFYPEYKSYKGYNSIQALVAPYKGEAKRQLEECLKRTPHEVWSRLTERYPIESHSDLECLRDRQLMIRKGVYF